MYANTASTLIRNWLLKNGCVLKKEAATSESKYITYGDVIIRISSHLPSDPKVNTIYIMIPVNNQHSFGVFVGKNYNAFNSLKELKNFLSSLFIVLDIKAFNQLAKINIQLKQLEVCNSDQDIVKLKAEINSLKQSNTDLKKLNNEQKTKIDRQRADIAVLHTKLAKVK